MPGHPSVSVAKRHVVVVSLKIGSRKGHLGIRVQPVVVGLAGARGAAGWVKATRSKGECVVELRNLQYL
jgi:hypothetical protein